MLYMIKVGSITNAQRAKRAFRRYGNNAYIIRLSQPDTADGCGYAVKVTTFDIEKAVALLEDEGIRVIGAVQL